MHLNAHIHVCMCKSRGNTDHTHRCMYIHKCTIITHILPVGCVVEGGGGAGVIVATYIKNNQEVRALVQIVICNMCIYIITRCTI